MVRSQRSRIATLVVFLLLLVGLVSCGGGGGNSIPGSSGNSADPTGLATAGTAPPVTTTSSKVDVVISGPSASRSVATRGTSVTLSGTATATATSVTVQGPSGYGAIASPLPTWRCADIPLAVGDNRLVATATTAAGETASASVVVVSNPGLDVGPLALTPDVVFIGQATPVTFRIVVEDVPGLDRGGVHLLRVDAQGRLVEDVGAMSDQGPVTGGRSFALQTPITTTAAGEIPYRVSVKVGASTFLSAWQVVTAVADLSAAEAARLLAVNRRAQATLDEAAAAGGTVQSAVDVTVKWLEQQPTVEDVLTFVDEENGTGTVTIYYSGGIMGGVYMAPAGTRGGPARAWKIASAPPPAAKRVPSVSGRLDDGRPAPDSLLALVSTPMAFDFQGTDEGPQVVELLKGSRAMASCYQSDMDANVDTYKNLYDYGVIHLETHGQVYFDRQRRPMVVFFANELTTEDRLLARRTDLRRGLLMVGEHFGITPAFIENYNAQKPLPGTIVIGNYCYSAFNESMWLAFAHVGASAYTGWTKKVLTTMARDHALEMYGKLCKGQTLKASFAEVVDARGFRPTPTPLRSVLFGNGDLCIDAGKVSITPTTATADTADGAVPVPFEAKLDGLDLATVSGAHLSYRWKTSGSYGKLRDASGKSGTEFTSSAYKVEYVPDEGADVPEGAKELVKVTALVGDCNDITREIGDAQAEIEVKSGGVKVSLAPVAVTVKTGEVTPFTATVKNLSAKTKVIYHWNSTGKAGTLADGVGQDDFDSDKTTVQYTAATPDASDTVTVEVYAVEPARKLLATATARVDVGTVSVALAPPQATLKALEQTALTASVSGLSPNTGVSCRWTCTATVGHLTDGTGQDSFTSDKTAVTYTALATAGADTVNVEVWTTGVTPKRLGAASARVEVTAPTVSLAPPQASLLGGEQQAFTCTVTGVASGASLLYHWTCTAAAGHLTDGTGTDDFDSAQAAATFTAAASPGGTDTVTVVAYATVGGNRVRLGDASASAQVQGPLIVNGDFSQQYTGWNWVKAAGYKWPGVNMQGYFCWKPGDPVAYMDVPNGCVEYFEQTVALPANTTLTLKYGLGGHMDPNVSLTVYLVENGTPVLVDSHKTPQMEQYQFNPNTGGYDIVCTGTGPLFPSVDISAWAGRTVTVRFQATSTGMDGDYALIDDVSIEVKR